MVPGLDMYSICTDPGQHLKAADTGYTEDDLDDLDDLYDLDQNLSEVCNNLSGPNFPLHTAVLLVACASPAGTWSPRRKRMREPFDKRLIFITPL